MSEHTPGPWIVGRTVGQHLRHGEDRCHWCADGPPIRVYETKTSNPKNFTDTVHEHLWEVEDGWRNIVAADGTTIVGNYDYEAGGVCTSKADALLIAAAPDLLDALYGFEITTCPDCDGGGLDARCGKSACRRCGGCGEVLAGGWAPDVRAAIAKATAEHPPEND